MPKAPEIKHMKRFASYLFTFFCFSVILCSAASAQVNESEIGSETGLNQSISRLTSTFEVKRAVIGLLVIAAISIIIFFLYWYKTAQLAKENYGFWEQLQKVESYDPERTLLFDDSLSVLRQAQREGIRHLYGIKKPDSERPEVEHDEFPLVEDFQVILPSRQK